MPRFFVLARPQPLTVEQVMTVLASLRRTLDKEEPFTVLWDLRQLQLPPRSVILVATDWMSQPENADPLDELVRGTAVLVKGPLIRAACSWCVIAPTPARCTATAHVSVSPARPCNRTLAICRPPNPVRICRDLDDALAFAREIGETEG